MTPNSLRRALIALVILVASSCFYRQFAIAPNLRGRLHHAIVNSEYQVAEDLIRRGADIDAFITVLDGILVPSSPVSRQLSLGSTVYSQLMSAVETGDIKMVQLLKRNGANVNAKSDYGLTALWIARQQKNPAMEKLLLRGGAKE